MPFFYIKFETLHIGGHFNKGDVMFEIDYTLCLGYIFHLNIKIFECIFEDSIDIFFWKVGLIECKPNSFLFFFIVKKCILQLLIEFVDILTLMDILVLDLMLDLYLHFFMGLFHLVFYSFLVIYLLLPLKKIQSVLFRNISVLGQQIDMLGLQVEIKIFYLV